MPNWHKHLNSKGLVFFFTLLIINLFLLLVFTALLFTPQTHAQPKPEPNIPCNEFRPNTIEVPLFPDITYGEEEYHSLRPYQASPCDPDIYEYRLYCGNDIIPVDKVKVTPTQATSCIPKADGGQTCFYSLTDRSVDISMTFNDAELPIIGNTQLVPNSVTDENVLNSAQRVNNYVSWYLNGVINRAEEPPLRSEKELFVFDSPILEGEDYSERDLSHDKVVNFSGPLRKLLPWAVQLDLRQTQIGEYAGDPVAFDNQRHDQVAACTFGRDIGISVLGFDLFSTTIGGIPIPCYDESLLNELLNFFELKQYRRLTDWEDGPGQPPKEQDPKYNNDYQKYWAAYREWRGESCGVLTVPSFIPIIGDLSAYMCIDNPGKPNFWADLYPYVPFSNTEDRKGDVAAGLPTIDPANLLDVDGDPVKYQDCISNGNTPTECQYVSGNVGLANQPTPAEGNDATITAIDYTPNPGFESDLLYFPHLKETTELATNLQDTFVPKEEEGFTGGTSVGKNTPFGEGDNTPYTTYRCDLKDVRWNSGDDLFGEWNANTTNSEGASDPTGPISGNIKYSADFSCDFGPPGFNPGVYTECIAEGRTVDQCNLEATTADNTCEAEILTAVSVYTRTPLVDELWGRLVAGDMSIFKKIYPKLGTGGMWDEIKDLPGVTTATYDSTADETLAGEPQNRRPGGRAEIFIPHLGGIMEYFLFGIQDALRPQGFKSSLAPGAPTGVAPGSGTCSESTTAYCSVTHLLPFFDGDHIKASNASMICNKESGGDPTSTNKTCLDPDGTYDYSIGLFQINLIAHCPEAFDRSVPAPGCKIIDQAKLDECEQFYLNPTNNIEYAKRLSNNGTSWSGPWVNASNSCGIY